MPRPAPLGSLNISVPEHPGHRRALGLPSAHDRRRLSDLKPIQITAICIQIFTGAGHSATNDKLLQAIRLRGPVDRFMASREFRIFP
jgi:hypothetical protein